jgi:hypothetical protein
VTPPAALAQVPKKVTDFFDKNLLQQFELPRFLDRSHDFMRWIAR